MAVTLEKGQGVSLSKNDNDLSQVTIGLGWKIATPKRTLGSMLFGSKKDDDAYDLDVVAFLCDRTGKVSDLGRDANGKATLTNGDVVFFNNKNHRSGKIWLTGDNRSGGDGDADDEQIIVNLNELPDQYCKVVFVVQIYDGLARGESFGNVTSAFIHAVDRGGKELVRFNLSGNPGYTQFRSMLFAELVREPNGWRFAAIGKPYTSDSFVEILKLYA